MGPDEGVRRRRPRSPRPGRRRRPAAARRVDRAGDAHHSRTGRRRHRHLATERCAGGCGSRRPARRLRHRRRRPPIARPRTSSWVRMATSNSVRSTSRAPHSASEVAVGTGSSSRAVDTFSPMPTTTASPLVWARMPASFLVRRCVQQVVGPLQREVEAGHRADRLAQCHAGEQWQPAPGRDRCRRPQQRPRRSGRPAAASSQRAIEPAAPRCLVLGDQHAAVGGQHVTQQVGVGRGRLGDDFDARPPRASAARSASESTGRRSMHHVTATVPRDPSPRNLGAPCRN